MTQTSIAQTENSIKIVTLAKSSVLALILQFVGVALAYLVQVFLARWMGKTDPCCLLPTLKQKIKDYFY